MFFAPATADSQEPRDLFPLMMKTQIGRKGLQGFLCCAEKGNEAVAVE
jgi:hypothetical protein